MRLVAKSPLTRRVGGLVYHSFARFHRRFGRNRDLNVIRSVHYNVAILGNHMAGFIICLIVCHACLSAFSRRAVPPSVVGTTPVFGHWGTIAVGCTQAS